MKRSLLSCLTLAAFLPTAAYAQNSCSRESLQTAVDKYLDTQAQGEGNAAAAARRQAIAAGTPFSRTGSPLFTMMRVGYFENFDVGGERMIDTPLDIDHHRSLLDTVACETFTEVIAAGESDPYLLGTRMRLTRGQVAEVEMMWATTGYWGFDAARFLKTATSEDWSPIPQAQRDTRKMLELVANAYMDALLLGKAPVEPWGLPCARTARDGSCQVGTPVPAVNIANRHYVIDETIGAIAVLCTFGADPKSGRIRTPDAHLFRVENGKIRYVHAVTHLKANAAK